jgi:hypothetical protein
VTIVDKARRVAMVLAPIGLFAFSLSHGTLSWSETQHLRHADLDQWIQHLTNIQGRWLAAHLGGVVLFPLIGMTIWWMLPQGAFAVWRDYGWRVSVPLATAGYVLAQSHFPPYGAIAGLALGIAVWQYLVLKRRVREQPSPPNPSTT